MSCMQQEAASSVCKVAILKYIVTTMKRAAVMRYEAETEFQVILASFDLVPL